MARIAHESKKIIIFFFVKFAYIFYTWCEKIRVRLREFSCFSVCTTNSDDMWNFFLQSKKNANVCTRKGVSGERDARRVGGRVKKSRVYRESNLAAATRATPNAKTQRRRRSRARTAHFSHNSITGDRRASGPPRLRPARAPPTRSRLHAPLAAASASHNFSAAHTTQFVCNDSWQ